MAKKSKARKAAAQAQENDAPASNSSQPTPSVPFSAGYFPFASYTSVVGVHTTLLAFATLFLPRTAELFDFLKPEVDLSRLTSRDRPQHPFLDALTASPVSTLACICVGAAVLQSWWGGWVRAWCIEFSLTGEGLDRQLARTRADARKFTVCALSLFAAYIHGTLTDAAQRVADDLCGLAPLPRSSPPLWRPTR
jgi:phosphatidylinositol glycan class F